MKLHSGKAFDYTPTVSHKRKANSSKEYKNEKFPSKQQKIDQFQVVPVSASLSSSSTSSSSSSARPASADRPSNVPDISSPISITKVLASTSTTASRATRPTRHQRGQSVDLTSQFANPSTLPIYSRSNPTWASLCLSPRTCTHIWYVVSSRRAAPRQHSSLGSSSFMLRLLEMPEEVSDDESLDIGSERQARFGNSITVYWYDSIMDHSMGIKINFYGQELK